MAIFQRAATFFPPPRARPHRAGSVAVQMQPLWRPRVPISHLNCMCVSSRFKNKLGFVDSALPVGVRVLHPPFLPDRAPVPRNLHFAVLRLPPAPTTHQMLSLSLSSAAFSLSPHGAALPSLGAPRLLRATGVRMADGEKPMKSANESPLSAVTDTLSKLPWNDLLLGFVTLDCARRLTDGVPALFGPSPNYFGTALDVLFVGYGTVELAKKAGILKDKDFYEELEGGEVRSFAYEAGQNALAGEVPFRTKVLHRASLDPTQP